MPPQIPHVLLIDDEETLRLSLGYALQKAGYEVATAADGAEALQKLRGRVPDVILLDVMLPGVDGLELCRRIRAVSDVPIIMLTARSELQDRVTGLQYGADDYVTKPFNTRELAARIAAVLRRSGGRMRSAPPAAPIVRGRQSAPGISLELPEFGIVSAGEIRMDLDRHEVRVAGQIVELAPKEFDLLHAFLAYQGRVLSREALLQAVWGVDFMGDPKTLDVHISWLRAKIEPCPSEPRHIITLRGVGFRLDS